MFLLLFFKINNVGDHITIQWICLQVLVGRTAAHVVELIADLELLVEECAVGAQIRRDQLLLYAQMERLERYIQSNQSIQSK